MWYFSSVFYVFSICSYDVHGVCYCFIMCPVFIYGLSIPAAVMVSSCLFVFLLSGVEFSAHLSYVFEQAV
jgi:hypothetical protein